MRKLTMEEFGAVTTGLASELQRMRKNASSADTGNPSSDAITDIDGFHSQNAKNQEVYKRLLEELDESELYIGKLSE